MGGPLTDMATSLGTATMSVFGRRVFADTVKDFEMTSSWIIQMVPQSNDKCPSTGNG